MRGLVTGEGLVHGRFPRARDRNAILPAVRSQRQQLASRQRGTSLVACFTSSEDRLAEPPICSRLAPSKEQGKNAFLTSCSRTL